MLVIPIAFTSDHIETLSELDREYGEVAHQVGITHYRRAPALNERPRFLDALVGHRPRAPRARAKSASTQYPLRCPGCTNPQCRNVLNPAARTTRRARGEKLKPVAG